MFKERTAMNFERSETSPETILRLTEVLRRTGFSRSTLYMRIADKEFPHQVSLGGRAVGWIKGEVDAWLNERKRLRPGGTAGISYSASEAAYATPGAVQSERQDTPQAAKPTSCVVFVNDVSPDMAQLHLVETKLYFDTSTGSFWLKLLAEDSASGGRRPRART